MKRILPLIISMVLATSVALADEASYSPFIQGDFGGWPAVVILLNGGGSMGAISARIFVDDGAQGVVDLGTVDASGGDNLEAFFAGGAVYLINRAPLPGECHACNTHFAVQRIQLRNHRMVSDGVITIEAPHANSSAAYESLLRKAALNSFKRRASDR